MEFRIHGFDVGQRYGLAEKLFVERQSEAAIEMKLMKDANADDSANKTEIGQVIL